MSDSVIARLKASTVRRGFALFVMMLLGFLLLYLTATIDAGFVHKAFLVGIAAAVLWMARAMQRGTKGHIELRASGLYFEDGRVLAAMDDILRVERGVFAFKPSNGFVVTLQNKTAPSEAKFMSDSLAVLLEERADSPLMNMKL